jgi:hypothetical protein
MIRNDGYLLLEDPDIQTTKRGLPPNDSLIYLFPDPHIDARLYEWEVLIRNDANDRIFVPADPHGPHSFVLAVSANQVKVTPTVPRDATTEIQIAGHLLGDHTLLKAEHRGLITQVVYDREPSDTTDFTTLDWILYRFRPEENREYIREDIANYSLVAEVDKVTVTLTVSTTRWVSTRLLGYTPSTTTSDGKVKGSSNDSTADYLFPKLKEGANITLTEINDGGYEQVEIASTAAGGGDTFPALCLTTDAVGDAVYIAADRVGSDFQVTKVDIDDSSSKISVGTGVLVSKPTTTTCTVRTSGRESGVLAGMTPGLSLFIQTDGSLAHTVPSGPGGGKRSIQVMGYALAADVLLVRAWPPSKKIPA